MCTAPMHGTWWAYKYGCRCPEIVARVRAAWRAKAHRQPRGSWGRGSSETTVADREAAVARLTAAGLAAREIAVQLRVTPRTVHRIRVRLRGAA